MRAFQAIGWNAALAALPSETHRSGAAFHIRGAIHRARRQAVGARSIATITPHFALNLASANRDRRG